MFMDIVASENWKSVSEISKGWSSDKKYLVETNSGGKTRQYKLE